MSRWAANILRVLDHATADELRDGLAFYAEFHGVARVLQRTYYLPSVEHGAGVLAALSPMNDWDSNVSDAFEVCRWSPASDLGQSAPPRVRTTNPNRDKAVAIRLGAHPEHALKGRKVRAFYLNTAAPGAGLAVAVDRHLACAAVGRPISDHAISSLLSTNYRRIEATYMDIGAAHGLLGHQLASVVWFTWRRMKATATLGQMMIREAA